MSAAKIIGIAVKTATIRELAHERRAGVTQMLKLCDLFFKNWIKKTSFQKE